jgi:DnaK suppressor protein
MATRLPKGYVPSDDEPFMNARQREYFRQKLQAWKDDLIKGTRETVIGL